MSTPNTTLWATALADLEGLIDRQTAALDNGAAAQSIGDELMFRVPAGLPPLPAHFVERVERLRRATELLINRTRSLADEAAPRQQQTHRRPAARRSTPRFDHRA